MKLNWDAVDALARCHQLEDPVKSIEALTRFLKFWWCKTYNRPFKDPLLDTYTTDDLAYEYLRLYYSHPDNDPLKEIEKKARQQSDDDWIKEQLALAAKTAQAKKDEPKPEEPKVEPPPEIHTKFD